MAVPHQMYVLKRKERVIFSDLIMWCFYCVFSSTGLKIPNEERINILEGSIPLNKKEKMDFPPRKEVLGFQNYICRSSWHAVMSKGLKDTRPDLTSWFQLA